MSGPALQEVVIIATYRKDKLLFPSFKFSPTNPHVSSSLRAITMSALSAKVMHVLRQCPHIRTLSIYGNAQASDLEHVLHTEPHSAIQLETLCCRSQVLVSCASNRVFHGLIHVELDSVAYPCMNAVLDGFVDSWLPSYRDFPVPPKDVLSSAAAYANTLQYLSFGIRDPWLIAWADNMDVIPTFPALRTCVVAISARRRHATVSIFHAQSC